jgi:hypothetical protein
LSHISLRRRPSGVPPSSLVGYRRRMIHAAAVRSLPV